MLAIKKNTVLKAQLLFIWIVGINIVVVSESKALDYTLYSDALYKVVSNEENRHSFAFTQVSISSTQALSQTSEMMTELVAGANEDSYSPIVDQLTITGFYHELLNVTLGRFHTPLGFWNSNYHHGSFIQDTVTRPMALEYENSGKATLPTHIVGVELNGDYDDWDYRLAIANSNGLNTNANAGFTVPTRLQVLNANDPSNAKTIVFRLAYKTEQWLEEFGLNFMVNNITELGLFDAANAQTSAIRDFGDVLFDQQVVGLDVRVEREDWYVFSEYYAVHIVDLLPNTDQTDYDATLYYLQFGWRYSDKVTYVLRYDDVNFEKIDNYYNLLGVVPETDVLFAVNYRLQDSNGIKLEVKNAKTDDTSENNLYLQWYFALL